MHAKAVSETRHRLVLKSERQHIRNGGHFIITNDPESSFSWTRNSRGGLASQADLALVHEGHAVTCHHHAAIVLPPGG